MLRFTIFFIGIVLSVFVAYLIGTDSGWFTIPAGLAVGFFIPLIDAWLNNRTSFQILGYSIRTFRTRVRVSISYLFRIRVGNEYMLIKGKRFHQFQPVGGVYKFYPSSLAIRSELDIRDDNLLAPDAVSSEDLRIRIPGRHLVAFFRWFESSFGREIDAVREFHEELVNTNILPDDLFNIIRYEYIRRHYEPMAFSSHAQSQELLVADIVELLPSPQQLNALKDLRKSGHPDVYWATESQIEKRGAVDGSTTQTTTIARNATWIIGGSS